MHGITNTGTSCRCIGRGTPTSRAPRWAGRRRRRCASRRSTARRACGTARRARPASRGRRHEPAPPCVLPPVGAWIASRRHSSTTSRGTGRVRSRRLRTDAGRGEQPVDGRVVSCHGAHSVARFHDAEHSRRQAIPLAVDDRGVHALALEVLRDHARAFGHRVRRRGTRDVGERRVVDEPRDAVEQPRDQRAREPGAHLVPVVAHERPHRGAVLAVAQRALDHERAVLRAHRVRHRELGRAEHELLGRERAERVEVAQLLLRRRSPSSARRTNSSNVVGVAGARDDGDRTRRRRRDRLSARSYGLARPRDHRRILHERAQRVEHDAAQLARARVVVAGAGSQPSRAERRREHVGRRRPASAASASPSTSRARPRSTLDEHAPHDEVVLVAELAREREQLVGAGVRPASTAAQSVVDEREPFERARARPRRAARSRHSGGYATR